jgi:hypothetical protein
MMIDEQYFWWLRQAEEAQLVRRLELLRIQRERAEGAGDFPARPARGWTMLKLVSRLRSRAALVPM